MMKRRGLLVCLMSGLFGLLGCAQKKMPEGDVVRVEIRDMGTMAGYDYFGRVQQDSSGTFVLRAMLEYRGPLFEKKLDAAMMKKFREIIEEEKMYNYKDYYKPKFEVLDGHSWSFGAKFSDGTVIGSHGSNAGPKDNGLERIREYMVELAKDGVEVEPAEDEE